LNDLSDLHVLLSKIKERKLKDKIDNN